MTTYNTGNPLGSAAAKDLFDNAQNLDFAVNEITKAFWSDRFGRSRKTWFGIQKDAQAAIASFGYITLDSFQAGAALTLPNQTLRDTDTGEYYRWDGEFPTGGKVVPSGSTPTSSGGVGLGAWVSVGDASLRSDLSSTKYRFIAGSENLASPPDNLAYGPGKVTLNGKVFDSFTPGVDITHSNLYMTPEDAILGAGVGYPADEIGSFNAVISIGAHPESAILINRTTAFGTNNFTKIISGDRNDAFGNAAMMFMRYGERNTMLGTITGQWLGTTDPAGDGHNYWNDAGGYIPGQSGWDYSGFETANPGVGAKIAAVTYVTDSTQCARNVGVGRNAFNGSVKLMNCTAIGYRASASLFSAEGNVAVGTDANRDGLFMNNSVFVGYLAGNAWQEGERNTVIGYQAGSGAITGEYNTLIGSFAGSAFAKPDNCIFIGQGGGNDVLTDTATPSNILAIGNDVTGVGSPLIVGNMAVPRVGINTQPSKLAGTFHVRTSDVASSPVTPHTNADDLIIENTSNTGMTIRSSATGLGSLFFSSPTVSNPAGVIYNHSTSSLTLRAAAADRWQVQAGSLNPVSDNSYSIGTASLRPSVIYAGTATINTSDERLKTKLEISEAEKNAALAIKSAMWKYKFNDSIENKGLDNSRVHFGTGAQTVGSILKDNGLNPEDYAFFCYDEWDDVTVPVMAERNVADENGNITTELYDTGEVTVALAAGNRYGIRYEELLCFIIAAM